MRSATFWNYECYKCNVSIEIRGSKGQIPSGGCPKIVCPICKSDTHLIFSSDNHVFISNALLELVDMYEYMIPDNPDSSTAQYPRDLAKGIRLAKDRMNSYACWDYDKSQMVSGPATFGIGQAVDILKNGGRVARSHWKNTYIKMEKVEMGDGPLVGFTDGIKFKLVLSVAEIFAEDWERR